GAQRLRIMVVPMDVGDEDQVGFSVLFERVGSAGGIDEEGLAAPLHHERRMLDRDNRQVALLGLDRVLGKRQDRGPQERLHGFLLKVQFSQLPHPRLPISYYFTIQVAGDPRCTLEWMGMTLTLILPFWILFLPAAQGVRVLPVDEMVQKSDVVGVA